MHVFRFFDLIVYVPLCVFAFLCEQIRVQLKNKMVLGESGSFSLISCVDLIQIPQCLGLICSPHVPPASFSPVSSDDPAFRPSLLMSDNVSQLFTLVGAAFVMGPMDVQLSGSGVCDGSGLSLTSVLADTMSAELVVALQLNGTTSGIPPGLYTVCAAPDPFVSFNQVGSSNVLVEPLDGICCRPRPAWPYVMYFFRFV